MDLSRRQTLRLGLLAGVGALLLGLPPARATPPRSPVEATLLGLVAQAILLPGDDADGAWPDPLELDAGTHAWAFVQHMPLVARLQLSGLLRALEHGARLRTGRPFSRLPLDQRHSLLVAMAESRLLTPRLALGALKQVCAMGTLRHPRTWAALGYDGPTLLRIPPSSLGIDP